MVLQEFVFQATLRQEEKKIEEIVLTCADCGTTETRPRYNLYTGHMHDQKCTYVCRICRGVMREV